MILRPYQAECLTAIHQNYRAGIRKQLIVQATGLGKAVQAACVPQYIPLPPGKRMLFLCHRDELASQAVAKLEACNPGRSVGLEKAQSYAGDTDIVVASVQTLGRGIKDTTGAIDYSPRLKAINPDQFTIIQVDEAHHSISPQWRHVLRYFRVLKGDSNCDPAKLLLGWTATPLRGDSLGLEANFEQIVHHYGIREAVKDTWLANIRAYRIETESDISQVHTTAGDLDTGELEDQINTPARNELIAREYLKLCPSKPPVICFTNSIAHSNDLAEIMQGHDLKVYPISGKTPDEERRRLIRLFKEGAIHGLTSCGILNEGTDLPNAEVGIMARPTKSGLLFRQQCGRILRPFPAPEEIAAMLARGETPPYVKQYATIIDVCDVTGRHELASVPTLFALRARFDAKGKDLLKIVEELEDLEAENPGLDLRAEPDMDAVREKVKRIKTSATVIDLLKPPQIPAEMRRLSKFTWLQDGPGAYHLGLLDHTLLSIRENALGGFDVCRHNKGIRTKLWAARNLLEAVAAAEREIPNDDKRVLAVNARWRQDPCTEKQIGLLFMRDRRLRQQFRTSQEFYKFALARYEAGDQAFSKGAVSSRIDSLSSAR